MKIRIPLETSRLYLDKYYETDWQAFFELEQAPEFHKYNRSRYDPRSAEKIKKRTRELVAQDYTQLRLPFILVIRLKETMQYIGFIGFKAGYHADCLKKAGQVELFYSLLPDYWNCGYTSEAVRALLHFGFRTIKLHRIWAGCDVENSASRRVMEKTGFLRECHWRKDRLREGEWKDGYGYALVSDDYLRNRGLHD